MRPFRLWLVLAALWMLPAAMLAAAEADAPAKKLTLRYKFHPGETLRWQVVHRAQVKTTVAGSTQTAETESKSVKVWRVIDVADDGSATFEHSVESVWMRQKLTGRQELTYDSEQDRKVPAGFAGVAESVGKPLSTITLNALGEVVKRVEHQDAKTSPSGGQITIPMPKQPVAVGQTWSFPYDIVIRTNAGTVKTIKTRQKFTLEEVKTGVATIRVATVVLTPIHDPAIETQLIQHQSTGTIRFDVDAGRVLSQQMDLDKRVVGFAGKTDTSSLHYMTRFTEQLLIEEPKTASRESSEEATKE